MVAAIGASSPVGEENDVELVPAWFSVTGATVKRHIWTRISRGHHRCRAALRLTLAFMLHLFAVDVGGVQVPLSLYRSCGSGNDGPVRLNGQNRFI